MNKVEKGNLLKEIGNVSCGLFSGDKPLFNRFTPSNALPQSHPQRCHRLITAYSQPFANIQIALEFFDRRLHVRVFFDLALNGFRRVNDRGVIAPAEFIADRWKGGLGIFAAEIHRHLARHGDVLSAPLCF